MISSHNPQTKRRKSDSKNNSTKKSAEEISRTPNDLKSSPSMDVLGLFLSIKVTLIIIYSLIEEIVTCKVSS